MQRSGQLLVLLAVGLGVAAITTNNNGLFFAWGLALGGMVLSGFISELSLRRLTAMALLPDGLRAQVPTRMTLQITNGSRVFAAWGLGSQATLEGAGGLQLRLRLPYLLRLAARQTHELGANVVPVQRGALRLASLSVRTSYPFGFFIKSRRLTLAGRTQWVWPRRVAVVPPSQALWASLGAFMAPVAGAGDEFFSLRAWRNGDDPRHIVWRRLARTQRAFVVEHEAHLAQELLLVAQVDTAAATQVQEDAIALIGSLAETLLARGFGVGLVSHGVAMRPSGDTAGAGRQLARVLDALARLDVAAPLTMERAQRGMPEVALVGRGLVTPSEGRFVLDSAQLLQSDARAVA